MTDNLRDAIRASTLLDEGAALSRLTTIAGLDQGDRERIVSRAADLVRTVRAASTPGVMESFLAEFGLSTKEGVALMCLAEALMRVPDAGTIDDLIADKIAPHDWGAHVGDSGSLMVNASTWALMLTGRVLEEDDEGVVGALRGIVRTMGEPVIRIAVARAMREMAAQFVLGRDIREAMRRGEDMVAQGYSYSYDMLGEAAWTEADAARYHGAYAQAIAAISTRASSDDIRDNPGISIKLSALHPRYAFPQRETTTPEMTARVLQLARAARDARIGLNIDAEEADRLDLSLDVIDGVLSDPSLAGWDGFGIVVQAYGPRAAPVLDWLYDLSERLDRRIMVRLVKGAYWDTEVKRAQVLGLDGFPVFTRKANTDVSYIACARKLLGMRDRIYPQFATHNAHTMAAVLDMAGDREGFEFQRLHGMGEALHQAVLKTEGTRCRIYAPVGAHRDLLAYLVRRLLENGANSSFVHQIVDKDVPPEQIARDPFVAAEGSLNPAIAHPSAIFGDQRRNAKGWDWTDPVQFAEIDAARAAFAAPHQWRAGEGANPAPVVNPADPSDIVGEVCETDPGEAADIIARARAAQPDWAARPAEDRAAILRRVADLYEAHAVEFFAMTAREAGKTLPDGIAEVREAVDFLRYYADGALTEPDPARGVIVCISPWNFPLAIFTGQIAAALAVGNAVIAKPAEQTPLIAARAATLMHEAGVPPAILQIAMGDGPGLGAALTSSPDIDGVCFTGSTEVARIIDRQLAETAPEAMLIAETGGLNAMIVDSTALPEQAVRDILASAFQSAGQRCSALRVLYLQSDVEAQVLEMLFGAMDALRLGDPWLDSTDVGPVIDAEARQTIQSHCENMAGTSRILKQLEAPAHGIFAPPTVCRIGGISELDREIFGPVLHVARFEADRIDEVISDVNASGYGLTFGLHSRIDGRVQQVVDDVKAGNAYVNRNQIGAVVGAQPFGGEGLSGTGPKAAGRTICTGSRVQPFGKTFSSSRADNRRQSDVGSGQRIEGRGLGHTPRQDLRPSRRPAWPGGRTNGRRRRAGHGPDDLPGPTGEMNR